MLKFEIFGKIIRIKIEKSFYPKFFENRRKRYSTANVRVFANSTAIVRRFFSILRPFAKFFRENFGKKSKKVFIRSFSKIVEKGTVQANVRVFANSTAIVRRFFSNFRPLCKIFRENFGKKFSSGVLTGYVC